MARWFSPHDEAKAQGQIWTPALLPGLAAWYDAKDLATISLNSGNVSQWSDKSGKGNHQTQATAVRQVPYDLAKKIVGHGADDYFEQTLTLAAPFNFFAISNIVTVDGTQSFLGDTNTTFFPFGIDGNTTSGTLRVSGASSSSSNFYRNGGLISTATYDDAYHACGFDIVGDTIVGITDVPDPMTTATGLFNHANDSYIFSGGFKELVFTEGTMSLWEKQKTIGHLAWANGLESLLVADHPFRNRPPLIGD